jgi:hypothetical protein
METTQLTTDESGKLILSRRFFIDGQGHDAPGKELGCCHLTGQDCPRCRGWMHFSGEFWQCEDCGNIRDDSRTAVPHVPGRKTALERGVQVR